MPCHTHEVYSLYNVQYMLDCSIRCSYMFRTCVTNAMPYPWGYIAHMKAQEATLTKSIGNIGLYRVSLSQTEQNGGHMKAHEVTLTKSMEETVFLGFQWFRRNKIADINTHGATLTESVENKQVFTGFEGGAWSHMKQFEATDTKCIEKQRFFRGFNNQRRRPLWPKNETCASGCKNEHCEKWRY